jgi:hypothetical protein
VSGAIAGTRSRKVVPNHPTIVLEEISLTDITDGDGSLHNIRMCKPVIDDCDKQRIIYQLLNKDDRLVYQPPRVENGPRRSERAY